MDIKNSIRRSSFYKFLLAFDKRMFPFLNEAAAEEFYVVKNLKQFKHNIFEIKNNLDPDIFEYFLKCNETWTYIEYLFHYTKKCTIEPSIGWALTEDNQIIKESIWSYIRPKIRPPHYFKYVLGKKTIVNLDSFIYLKFGWNNYFHFFNDILGPLFLADKFGIPKNTPVIIPAGLAERSYFKKILELSPYLQSRNWVLQKEDTYFKSNNAYFLNTFLGDRAHFDGILNWLDLEVSPVQLNEKVFLIRDKSRGRSISNIEEISIIAQKYGFRIVDTDLLDVNAQIKLFSSTRYLISIHGAGLTNMIFRKDKPMNILEIFPAVYFNPVYYCMAIQYNFGYFAMKGETIPNQKSPFHEPKNFDFIVNKVEFEKRIQQLLQA